MQTQHTPGPWRNGWGKIVDADGKAICMVTYRKAGDNANLLAAAPDLLAALQSAAADVESRTALGLDAPAWYAQARAAIAKATGGQP
jgi:hypothetical protein